MMNPLMLKLFTFLIVAPAISICDEDLSKVNSDHGLDSTSSFDSVTRNPFYVNNEGTDYTNENAINDPWSFYRHLRAPSGFFGVRGKKDFEPVNYWEHEVHCNNFMAFDSNLLHYERI